MAIATAIRSRLTGLRRVSVRGVLWEMRKEWTAYLFLSPGLILFCIFWVFTIGFSFYLSFHEWSILEPAKFVGLDNYARLLEDRRFHQAIVNTIYYTAFSVPLTMVAGLSIALLLNNRIHARGVFRTLYYVPVITPLVVAAIIWKWVYQGDYGLLNYYLQRAGLVHRPLLWLSDPNLAMPAVIMMSVWGGAGYDMVIYLAGLQGIPQEYYDAAMVDGANSLQRLFRITIPLLAPTTFFLFVTAVIGSFQIFTQIFIMTGGGPLGRTTTIGYRLYEKAFRQLEMGYASAMAYALFAMVLVFTLLQLRYMRNQDLEY